MVSEVEKHLLPLDQTFWHDGAVPLNERGIKFSWLYGFLVAIDSVLKELSIASLTTRDLVSQYIVPLTAEFQAPLYARVPVEHRGPPSIFISHTWSSRAGFGGHGSLDMVLENDRDSFVWIDIACYNQHRAESVVLDMNRIISSVPRIAFALTTEPFWARSWCIWELVCANRVGAEISVYNQILRITKKYWNSEAHLMPPPFRYRSVWDLSATKWSDQKEILDAMISTFGSVERADEHISTMLTNLISKLPKY